MRASLFVSILVALAMLIAGGSAHAEESLDACDALARDHPDDTDSYGCFVDHAERSGQRRATAERLEAWVALRPDDPRPKGALAWTARFIDSARSVELLREAVAGYEREGAVPEEANARQNLFSVLRMRGQLDEARVEADLAQAATERANTRRLSVRQAVHRSQLDYARTEFSTGWLRLRKVESTPEFAQLGPRMRYSVYQQLRFLAKRLGLRESDHRYATQMAALAEQHDMPTRAQALGVLADSAISRAARGRMDRSEARAIAERALAAALAKNGTVEEVVVRIHLAKVSEPEEALEHLRIVERKSRENPFCRHLTAAALYLMGEQLIEHYPQRHDEAIELLVRGVEEARSQGRNQIVLSALSKLFRGRFAVGPRDLAIASAREALDYLDGLASAQHGDTLSVQYFSRLTHLHYEFIDYLLGEEPAARLDGLEIAFHTSERMRARALRVQLARMESDRGTATALDEGHRELLKAISDSQLTLMLPSTSEEERERVEAELVRFELEEETLRNELARASPAYDLAGAEPVGLAEVQAALADDQALLSFLLASNERTGSWLIVVTRDETRAYPMPDRRQVEQLVWMWRGVLQLRDGSDGPGAERLYRELLADALEDLPSRIRRLLIVPDGPTHRLAFDGLRRSVETPPLAQRFEISVAPSATVWLRLQTAENETVDLARALLVADPRPVGTSSWPSSWRSALTGGAVGRLPHSRTEARAALHALGRGAETIAGQQASETYLKQTDLTGVRLLHLAAHAIVDEENPARSAILLTPGPGQDDGLLQPREIADLRLDGALVTLSACRSVGGTEALGEGVLGFARAFFQARARSVVGGLWPLHDAETAELMEVFYRLLADGKPVSAALAGAKRELIRRGAPSAAWAGVVAVGATDVAPWPRRTTSTRTTVLVTIGAGLLAVVLLLISRRHRRAREEPSALTSSGTTRS